MAPPLGSQVRTKEQKSLSSKCSFSESGRCRALIFGIKHFHGGHVFQRIKISRTVFEKGHPRNNPVKLFQNQTKFVHMMLLGSRMARPGGHKFEYRNKEGKIQNSSALKLEGLELSYLVYSISWWTSTKFVHIMPLGLKTGPASGDHKLGHRKKEAHFQNSSSLKLEGV